MRKEKTYERVKFTVEVIKEALAVWLDKLTKFEDLSVSRKPEKWKYNNEAEFFADYRNEFDHCTFWKAGDGYILLINVIYDETIILVEAPSRPEIEEIFVIFEAHLNECKLPPLLPTGPVKPEPPVIYIGHGRSSQWKDLKDHLHEKHGYKVEAYETGARAGHTIRDILEEMMAKSSFAILVMTGEDQMRDKKLRARQNVIHEAGLFQGRLGFSRTIILLEKGAEEFSNIHGIHQIRYSKGNIKETFGEILATLRREFGI
jgi:hypothetical protein